MYLSDIEDKIKYLRTVERRLLTRHINEQQINFSTVISFEKGKNYQLSTLFMILNIFSIELYAEDQAITDLIELGKVLEAKRKDIGLSLIKVSEKSGLLQKNIISVEKGRGFTKKTLLKYLEAVPIKLEIKDTYETKFKK